MGLYDSLLDEVFNSSPLPFIREFLRQQKSSTKAVRIGTSVREVRSNLQEALNAQLISPDTVRAWLRSVEGFGRQHLYIYRVPKRSLAHPHLLNESALRSFVKRRRLDAPHSGGETTVSHRLSDLVVDDEVARLIWQAGLVTEERRKEFDETRELDDGEYLFKAYRRTPKRSSCQLIVRKTDAVAVLSIDLPLADEHDELRKVLDGAAQLVLAPLTLSQVQLGPIVSGLDEAALSRFGPKQKRGLAMGVEPTQAKYRAEGAQIDFRSTRESKGYTASTAIRQARRALQVEQVVGEAGKFRLTFEDKVGNAHTMVVSFDARENRVYLFSRMKETEVLALVDQIVALS